MTRLLAHAITRRATGGPPTGLRGRPLEQIAAGELGLWATRWDEEPTLSRDDAFAHHDLVALLCDAGPCLPVRFGTWLADAEAARRSLEAQQDRFTAAVDRLADRREVAITLLWRDAPSPEGRGHGVPPSGRAYLERRRQLQGSLPSEFYRDPKTCGLGARVAGDLGGRRTDRPPRDRA